MLPVASQLPDRQLLAKIQQFTVNGRPPLIGVLARYNKKAVTVITDGGERWSAAPGLPHRVVESDDANVQNPNVFPIRKGKRGMLRNPATHRMRG